MSCAHDRVRFVEDCSAFRRTTTAMDAIRIVEDASELPWWMPVWRRFGKDYSRAAPRRRAGEQQLRRELLFCLLGGHGITYELNVSAVQVLLRVGIWDHLTDPPWIAEQLRRPQFRPLRCDGTLRCYRFPNAAAARISTAFSWVAAQGTIVSGLRAARTSAERRRWLCTCPGIGAKTASWLLRNSGWARDVAVLDIHVLRALQDGGRLDAVRLPRDYDAAERVYLTWAEDLDASPAALDLFLWDVYRLAGQHARAG